MKRLFFTIILLLSLILLAGCANNKYPPVKSTEEEEKVVITLKIEDKEYNVKYELYRALFLNNKTTIDKGQNEIWSGDKASQYINQINDLIINDAAEIFSVLHLANKIGYNPYSQKADYDVEDMFKSDIESFGTTEELSDSEKYDAFLKNLKKNNLNYSVADLLYRYALSQEAIYNYYRTEYEYSEDDVKNYYESDNCARILQAYFQTGIKTYAQMQAYRENLACTESELSLAAKIISSTSATESDLIDNGKLSGIIIGKQTLTQNKYSNYIDEIFSLSDGELSNIITLENTNQDGYYIVYRLEKNNDHFDTFYPVIANSYLDNIVGGILGGMEIELVESKSFNENYATVSHKDISMN